MSQDFVVGRRGFLKGSAMAALGTMAAGSLGLSSLAYADEAEGTFEVEMADNKGIVTKRNDAGVEYRGIYDVVVMGAGGAGLCAATAAVDAGAKVLVVDSQSGVTMSNTALCAGVLMACCTRQQEEAGVEDSPENFRAYLEATSKGYMSETVIDTWVNDKGATVEWLEEHGVEFPTENLVYSGAEEKPEFAEAATPAMRGHYDTIKSGSQIIDCLYKHCQDAGVDFEFNCRATDLISDPDGRIVGIVTEKGNYRGDKGIIICSGGFIRNEFMTKAYLGGEFGSASSLDSQTGEGQMMCMSVGAKTMNMWCVQSNSFGAVFSEGYMPSFRLFNTSLPCIALGSDGTRKVAEDVFYEYRSKVVRSLDDPYLWIIWDQDTTDIGATELFVPKGSDNCDSEVERGIIFRDDTIEGLCEQAGLDAEVVAASIARYNEMAEAGTDEDFGRTKNLAPVINPPFYACKAFPKGDDTAGGAVLSAKGEVLNWDDEPIPGLYAAGAVTGGWRGAVYPGSGTSVATGALFGRLAGANAAAEAGSNYEGTLAAVDPNAEAEEAPAEEAVAVDCSPCHGDAHKPGDENPHGY